jgi:hypothetical protein
MEEQTIEAQIFTLFSQLSDLRQVGVVEALAEYFEGAGDGIDVEIIDEEDGDPSPNWGKDEIIDNEQPLGWIDDKPIHRK